MHYDISGSVLNLPQSSGTVYLLRSERIHSLPGNRMAHPRVPNCATGSVVILLDVLSVTHKLKWVIIVIQQATEDIVVNMLTHEILAVSCLRCLS